MTPPFNDPAAARTWRDYFAEVERRLVGIDEEDRAELRSDLETHLADSFAAESEERGEADRLASAIRRLGRPADYLRPVLADQLLARGTRTYNPTPIARGLYHSLKLGSTRAATAVGFAFGYIALAIFALMALLKPFWGDHVGLFREPNGTISFGIVGNSSGGEELLGFWIIPISLFVVAVLYIILTRALRSVRTRV